MKINKSYLAGVVDSDGSFSITKRNTSRINPSYVGMFQLTWVHNEVTDEFMKSLVSKYGGSFFIQTEKRNAFPNASMTVKYCATGKALNKIIKDVYPFLILKRSQAYNLWTLNETQGKYGAKRPKPEDMKQFHESLYLENRKLNSKNGAKL